MIYLQDADVTIHQGDVLDELRKLPDESVHMCCTSPPFYGLRDYGTGTWEGGDEGCDHLMPTEHQKQGATSLRAGRSNVEEQRNENFRDVCGKCGARRVDQQIGLEATPDEWVARLVEVFREVRRVLRSDGTCWVEIGDSYTSGNSGARNNALADWSDTHARGGARMVQEANLATPRGHVPAGMKTKDLIGAPWLLAFALRADGWYLRSEIIWAKPNPMPESVSDRPTTSHSRVFLLAKQPRYFYDAEALRENAEWNYWGSQEKHKTSDPLAKAANWNMEANGRDALRGTGRNRRSVWTIATQPYPEAHFATWPEALCRDMILAGTSERGVCPECGAPWERVVSKDARLRRPTIGLGGHNEHTRSGRPSRGPSDDSPSGPGNQEWSTTTVGWEPACGCPPPKPVSSFLPEFRRYAAVPATVLDPFGGSGTTAHVARKLGRRAILIELNADYCELAAERLAQQSLLAEGAADTAPSYAVSALPPDKEKNPSDAPGP